MSVFGDNLKAARLAKGMTLVQSANALGITNPALSQWEQGKREPKLDMLLELCYLFDTSPNELLGFEAPSAPGTAVTTGANSPIISGNGNSVTIGAPGSPGTARPTRKRK
jgi:transcriptional regulator with XRE-family HTH domain